jgi:hypothetical protein
MKRDKCYRLFFQFFSSLFSSGEYWEEKVEHCNNLLHWLPFELMNEAADVTNLYYRGNRGMKNYACHGARHCIDKAPLFAMLGMLMW